MQGFLVAPPSRDHEHMILMSVIGVFCHASVRREGAWIRLDCDIHGYIFPLKTIGMAHETTNPLDSCRKHREDVVLGNIGYNFSMTDATP